MAAANAPATATATGNAPAAITLLPPQPGSRRTRHPQADLIREKIDWYFSNENLKKDQLILNCINAKGPNSAVNIYRVAGRLKKVCESKISDWQVIDACRGSKMVDVVDKNHIRRKVPYVVDDSDEDDGIWGEEDKRPRLKPIPAHPGIKAGTFVKSTATGFEEKFTDAPMTPKEYGEECELYNTDNDVASRIGYAIERFGARRKFTSVHQKAFGDFLKYGGVYPASRIGQGDSKKQIQENEELSKEEKLELCAQYDVDIDDKQDKTKWAIDFEGVVKAYLSSKFAMKLTQDYNDDEVDNQCNVLTNFYNYLLYHNVCPEYKADIIAARNVGETARIQLKIIQKLVVQFPSPFNKACSVLFGGVWQLLYGHDSSWGEDPQMSKDDAKIIVGAALMSLATDTIYDAAFPEDGGGRANDSSTCFPALKYIEKRFATLEVTAIERATDNARDCHMASGLAEKQIKAAPLGKLICKSWPMPSEDEWDIPPHLQPNQSRDTTYAFWLEDDILADFFASVKMIATIYKLDVAYTETQGDGDGVWVLDSVARIYCSFFTWLENELCTHKGRGVEWYSEDALVGCRHEEARMARDELVRMREQMKAKAEAEGDDEGEVTGENG